jgi:DNA repair protein RecN (Recombination protein N)
MLETLRIQNYALIDRLEVEFRPGFSVLSGETGAGKSIIVGALGLVLGARASADMVRDGEAMARVEAVFRIDRPSASLRALLREHDVELEEGALLLARSVGADGRGKAYAGDRIVPVSLLAALGDELVDLHGQHEHQSLLRPDCQMDLLDAFAGAGETAEQVAAAVARLSAIDRDIAALETDDRERARRAEFLRFEVDEIDAAGLQSGEEDELRARQRRITHAETLFTLANQVYSGLYENESGAAIDSIDAALKDLGELSEIDGEFGALSRQLAEAREAVDSVAQEIRQHTSRMEFDAGELDELNRRLAMIGALKRKYGPDVDAILAYRERAAAELAGYENRDERLEALRRDRAATLAGAMEWAGKLSAARRAAGAKLDKLVIAALRDLDMKGAQFETRVEETDLCARGVDRVEFMLSANAGERPRPLRTVASGGEISRIMLALKSVFAGVDRIPTLVFDEIDAGVGGVVARRVAEKMAALARSHQVICITHLAQIAAAGETHYTVSKHDVRGHAVTGMDRVDGDGREREVARLLDGSVSEISLGHARALLEDMKAKGKQ